LVDDDGFGDVNKKIKKKIYIIEFIFLNFSLMIMNKSINKLKILMIKMPFSHNLHHLILNHSLMQELFNLNKLLKSNHKNFNLEHYF
jgi:hypothetical protein